MKVNSEQLSQITNHKNKTRSNIFGRFLQRKNSKKKPAKECKTNLVLVGNPNTGKTTLFNSITKSDEHVGNWHGVTVDYKEKITKLGGELIKVTDLPGLYSLTSYSYEEQVARDYILGEKKFDSTNKYQIINICDANNLARNLYLTLQLIELGKTPVVCVNMANELARQGKQIDADKLGSHLGLKVVLLNAQKKAEALKVVEIAKDIAGTPKILPYFENLRLEEVKKIIAENKQNLPDLNDNFVAIKVLEKDEFVLEKLKLSAEQISKLNDLKLDETSVAVERYLYIESVIKDCIKCNSNKAYGYSKLDKIVLNKFLALPIFLAVVSLIFFITFSSVGRWLTELLSSSLENYIFTPCLNILKQSTNNEYLISFVKDAIFGGVGSLLSFLPQIALLFLSLSILEDSGYMSRLAFTLEDYFAKIGLTGKSVFALLMGFGCSTTSAMTSRNLEDKNSKIKTAMLSPYLSCSAKIPLYTVILSAFFFKYRLLIIILLYLLSVIVAVVVSYVLEKTILKSGEQSFIMELPPYRFPSFKRILKVLYANIKSFVLRVGTMIVSFSIIIWILQTCDITLNFNPENSILKSIGTLLAPIFAPLGFGSWGAVVCLICGVVAKEIIVGTMGIINNISSENALSSLLISQSLLLSTNALSFNSSSALSFLVFSLLYMPCISTISVMKKEIGTKWTTIAILIQFAIAYILAFATYKISVCFCINGFVGGMVASLIFASIVVSFIIFKKFVKSKNKCKFCPNQKRCGKTSCN